MLVCTKSGVETAAKPPKTRAEMMARIAALERLQDYYRVLHERKIAELELKRTQDRESIYKKFAEGLLETHVNGAKEGSFPRRPG